MNYCTISNVDYIDARTTNYEIHRSPHKLRHKSKCTIAATYIEAHKLRLKTTYIEEHTNYDIQTICIKAQKLRHTNNIRRSTSEQIMDLFLTKCTLHSNKNIP